MGSSKQALQTNEKLFTNFEFCPSVTRSSNEYLDFVYILNV